MNAHTGKSQELHMSEEAEVAAAAPENSSAPETTTDEANKPAEVTDAKAEQGTEGKKPDGADEKGAAPASAETEDDEGEAGKPKKPTRTSQLRATIREKSLQIEALERRLAEREADDKRQPPKEEDYNGDFEAYNRDLIAHKTAELLRKERSEDERRDIEDRQMEVRRERLADHNERVSEARKVIPDYDQVVTSGLKNIDGNPKNLELLLESEKSELIAYHLAERPERAREFARMDPYEAARHLGKLESRLSLPKPKTQTEAPPPVSTLKGGAIPQVDPAKMSMAEYAEWRNKQLGKAS